MLHMTDTWANPENVLTPRQLEILELVSKGCSNLDIARLLEISHNTVKAHLATVLERLHVSNRTEASVLYQKYVNKTPSRKIDKSKKSQHISISLLHSELSRTSEIADNISHLLRGMEIFKIHSTPIACFFDESIELDQDYLIKVDDLSHVDAELQISLFRLDHSNQKELLYKSEHNLANFKPRLLIKHAVKIYRHILQDQKEKMTVSEMQRLSLALSHYEAVSFDQLQVAIRYCDDLISQNQDWYLPIAVKSVVLNKLITNGLIKDVNRAIKEQAGLARKALSMQPSSSWSQLAFAAYCALNADLELAEKHLNASLRLNQCQLRAAQLLGQIQAFTGQTNASLHTFEQLLSNFPNRESDAACFSALALVYYCANDYKNSQVMANRALLYQDVPKVPMLLTLLSIAEIEGDQIELKKLLKRISELGIDEIAITNSLKVAGKIVPPKLHEHYVASIVRSGLVKLK